MREVWCTQCKITCHHFKDVTAIGKSSTWRWLEAAAGSRNVEPCVCLFHKALTSCFISAALAAGCQQGSWFGSWEQRAPHTWKIETLGQTTIYIIAESDHSRHLVFIWFFKLYTIWYSAHEGNTITQFEKAEKNTGRSKDQASGLSLQVCTQRLQRFWTHLMEGTCHSGPFQTRSFCCSGETEDCK